MTTTWLRIFMWIMTIALSGFGLVMIASTTAMQGGATEINHGMVIKQAVAMVVGVVMALLISWGGIGFLTRGKWVFLACAVAIASLLAVLVMGRSINGAKRWLEFGGFNVQPAELAKVAVVLAGAWWFAHAAERVRAAYEGVLVPLIGFVLLGGLVFVTKDLGSVVVMGVTLAGLLLFAGANIWYFGAITVGMLPLVAYVAIFRESYRYERIMAFLDPNGVEGPAGYHLRQNIIALGSGGMAGAGLGESIAKYGFVPECHTDSIFAVIGAELGLIGALILAGVYLLLAGIGLVIAWRAGTLQGRLIAIGCTLIIATQAFWHMLVDAGGVPTKGLTLPFISYGGSSVVVCMALIGMLDAVAKTTDDVRSRNTTVIRGAVIRSRERWNQVVGRPHIARASSRAAPSGLTSSR